MDCLDCADAQTVLDLRYSDMTRRHCFKRNGPSLNRRIIKAGTTQGRTLQDTTPSLNQSKCDSSERDLHELFGLFNYCPQIQTTVYAWLMFCHFDQEDNFFDFLLVSCTPGSF